MTAKVYTSYAWLYRKYVTLKLTEQEMAVEADTTQATINRWLAFHKIKRQR